MSKRTKGIMGWILSLIMVVGIMMPTISVEVSAAAAKNNAKVVNTKKTAVLYKSAKTSSKKVAKPKKNADVRVTAYTPKKKFSKVTVGKKSGHMLNTNLKVEVGVFNRVGIETIKANAKLSRKATVYAAPDTKSQKLKTLKKGAKITVLKNDFSAKWTQVNYNGYVGYIQRKVNKANTIKLSKATPAKGLVPIKVGSVKLSPASTSLNIGETTQITAIVAPAGAKNKKITWVSNNPAVATVSSSGLVRAVKVGNATITATAKDGTKKSASIAITVMAPETPVTTKVTGVSINNPAPKVGDVISATIEPAGATVTYSWSTGGVSKGTTATYTVQADDVGKTIKVTVIGNGNYTGTVTSVTPNTVVNQAVEDEQKVAEVTSKIGALGDNPTAKEIEAARKAYDDLTPAQKDLVAQAVLDKLEAAEEEKRREDEEAVGDFELELYNACYYPSAEGHAKVREIYENLTADQKAMLPENLMVKMRELEVGAVESVLHCLDNLNYCIYRYLLGDPSMMDVHALGYYTEACKVNHFTDFMMDYMRIKLAERGINYEECLSKAESAFIDVGLI